MAECPELREWPQTRVEWRIKNFRDLPTEVGFCLRSPRFLLSGTEWYISIYPNGQVQINSEGWIVQLTTDSEGWIGLFLNKEESHEDQHVDFSMEIRNYDGTVLIDMKIKTLFKIRPYGRGWYRFIKKNALSDTVSADGSLTIFCSAAIVDGSPAPSTKRVAPQTLSPPTTMEAVSQTLYSDEVPNLCKDLKDLYVSKRFTDVTVQVKSREFHAHRNILATRSAVFAAMLRHDTKESKNGRVRISDCDPDTFEDFLLTLYTGKLDVVTFNNAFSLYETSEKYDVQALKEECVRCMTHALSVDSFCDVLYLANKYKESELLKTATDFFINNTKKILMTSKWHTFLSENPMLGNELFLKTFTK